ncbi:MAG: HipA domain-containing protein, partial [Xanthomonadales bacterium]|nr:HipA domain-containing protein [Xanthomonadales bacterium]
MRERAGSVWYEDHRVGSLRSDSRGAIHFRYDSDWLERGFPVSLQLPLAQDEAEVNAHAFFQGLLPEGRSRRRICRRLRIDPNDDAGLLLAIGEDCAGALSILADAREPDTDTTPPQEFTIETIRTLVRSRGEAAPNIVETPQRFSLAGAQEKLPVIYREGRFFQPNRNHPSTHILKFETHRHVCFAEQLSLDLAKALGLVVVDASFRVFEEADGEIPYLLISRYDRRVDDDGNVHRLHQEDMIQALGYETDFKYQSEGGPGLDAVIPLLTRETANPPEQIRRVIDWQIFNYLVGNYDAHGKNLALLYGPTSALPQLAPFYDLV